MILSNMKDFLQHMHTHPDDQMNKIQQGSDSTLNCTLNVMDQLVRWLVKSGIGHHEFSDAMRSLFYNAALEELEQLEQKKTDSALSLLSGLNRREVSQLRQINAGKPQKLNTCVTAPRSNVPSRVIALWVALDLPHIIPTSGAECSFEALVRQISSEKHPRSILAELIRLKLVIETGQYVWLQTQHLVPNPTQDINEQILSDNVADHLAAGITNLSTQPHAFLEQSVCVEHLSLASVEQLKMMSQQLWAQYAEQIFVQVKRCVEIDQANPDASYRFRVGIYQYDTAYPDA